MKEPRKEKKNFLNCPLQINSLSLSKTTYVRLIQTEKKIADDNFKFDENGREFAIRVKNTGEKGDCARHEQFLLFAQCFKRILLQIHKKEGLFGKG